MTADQFNQECHARLIDPAVALENEAVRTALEHHNDDEVREILDNDF